MKKSIRIKIIFIIFILICIYLLSPLKRTQQNKQNNSTLIIENKPIKFINIEENSTIKNNKLNFLLKNNKLSIKELSERENLILSFLENDKITRKEKINTLWKIFNNLDNIESKKYILDYLLTMKPIELTTNIIEKYKKIKNISLKQRLIVILNNSLFLTNKDLDEDKLEFIAKKTEEIEGFFKDELLNIKDYNSILSKELIDFIPNIFSYSESYDIINQLTKKIKLPIKQEYLLKIRIAFSTQESQLDYIPSLLENIKNLSSVNRKNINDNIYSLIKLGSNNEYILSDLNNYLDNQKSTLNNKALYKDYLELSANKYNWLEAKASISGIKKEDFIVEILLNSKKPIDQANIIVYADNTILNKLDSDKKIIIQNIKRELENNMISINEKNLLNAALQILEEDEDNQINDFKSENLPPIPTNEIPY